jgi:hypothetical protein
MQVCQRWYSCWKHCWKIFAGRPHMAFLVAANLNVILLQMNKIICGSTFPHWKNSWPFTLPTNSFLCYLGWPSDSEASFWKNYGISQDTHKNKKALNIIFFIYIFPVVLVAVLLSIFTVDNINPNLLHFFTQPRPSLKCSLNDNDMWFILIDEANIWTFIIPHTYTAQLWHKSTLLYKNTTLLHKSFHQHSSHF